MKISKTLLKRVFWFGVGGVASVALNAGLFHLLHTHFAWIRFAAYATSLLTINLLQFVWNYFVGFTSTEHWTVSARRQFTTLVAANGLNYGLVMLFQGVFPRWPEAVIAVVQVFISGFKFLLYHYWVYPAKSASQVSAEARI